MVVLALAITCESGTGQECDSYAWSGTPTVPPIPALQGNATQVAETAGNTLIGLSLVDPTTGTEYIPVTDASNDPASDPIPVEPRMGDSYTAWAFFPAPPTTLTTVTVVLPGGSPRVAGVPIGS